MINLGGLESTATTFPGFPSQMSPGGNSFYPQVEVIFKSFYYFQNGLLLRPGDSLGFCLGNVAIQAGIDSNSFPIYCAANYSPFHEVSACLPLPATPVTFCEHNMDATNSKCYRCGRGFGHSGTDPCVACAANCLSCIGSGSNQCTYCAVNYGFTGTACVACDPATQTFDTVTNQCQKHRQYNVDLKGDASTIGGLKVFFIPLNAFADQTAYFDTAFNLYWLKDMDNRYRVLRSYSGIPRHRKATIYFQFLINNMDWGYLYVAVDGVYAGLIPLLNRDPYISVPWGQTSFNWNYYASMTVWHSADTMTLGIRSDFNNDMKYWIRDVRVSFFGCYVACSDCFVDNAPLSCTACEDGYFLSGFQCFPCGGECQTCAGSATTCLSCGSGLFLKDNGCLIKCDVGFFVGPGNVCLACAANCVQCLSLTKCLSCAGGFFNNAGLCQACSASCLTCAGAATTCASCAGGLLLQDGTCVASCSAGYILSGLHCLSCGPGCGTCDTNTCLACLPGYLTKHAACVSDCGTRYYQSSPTACDSCDSRCQTCSGSPTNCQGCMAGYFLSGSSCVACSSPCLACSAPASCLSCQVGFFLNGVSCISSCPPATFASAGACVACSATCATCSGSAGTCTTCPPGKFLQDQTCLASCAAGYWGNAAGACCPDSCTACLDSQNCSACVAGHFLSSGGCPVCNSDCAECQDSESNCTGCVVGKWLLTTGGKGQCVVGCPIGWFAGTGDRTCRACAASCLSCSGPLDGDCLSCVAGRTLWAGKCVECLAGTGPFDLVDGQCVDFCGDGKKFSELLVQLYDYNECDDGNSESGDGCSSSCQVEPNFACTGGSQSTADSCRSIVAPTASLQWIEDNIFKVKFSEPVTLSNLADVVSMKVNCSKTAYDLSPANFTLSDDSSSGLLSFSNITLLLGQSCINSTFTVTFDRSHILSRSQNALSTSVLTVKFNYTFPLHSGLESATNSSALVLGLASYVATLPMVGGPLVAAGAVKASAAALRASYFVFIDSAASDPLQFVAASVFHRSTSGPNFTNPFPAERILLGMKDGDISTDVKQMKTLLTEKAMGGLSFASEMSFIVFLILLFLSMILELSVGNRMNQNIPSFIRFIHCGIRELSLFSYFYNSFPIIFFAIRALKSGKDTDLLTTLTNGLAIFSFAISPAVSFYLANNPIEVLWHPYHYHRYGSITAFHRLDYKRLAVYASIDQLRQVLFAIILAVLMGSPLPQSILLFSIQGLLLILLIRNKPYANKVHGYIVLVLESLELGILFLFGFNNFLFRTTTDTIRDATSLVIIVLILIFLIVHLIHLVFIIIWRILCIFSFSKATTTVKPYSKISEAKFVTKIAEPASPENAAKDLPPDQISPLDVGQKPKSKVSVTPQEPKRIKIINLTDDSKPSRSKNKVHSIKDFVDPEDARNEKVKINRFEISRGSSFEDADDGNVRKRKPKEDLRLSDDEEMFNVNTPKK